MFVIISIGRLMNAQASCADYPVQLKTVKTVVAIVVVIVIVVVVVVIVVVVVVKPETM